MPRVVFLVLLFILLVIFWPVIYGGASYIRIGSLEPAVLNDLLLLLPMGFVGASVAILPSLTRKYSGCLSAGLTGYLIASPIAFLGSFFGGLVLPPWMAAVLIGSAPLLIFTFISYQIGEKMNYHKNGFHY